ncbi:MULTISPECIES: bifunctional metallophosphatase/5'-nucleotidase [Pseudomonas]|uniref:Bifunctional metallophosphatase/5'-nucleotidase n=1 Tax=Pseudomonas piscis TaxID=2614538 RepID=A0A7X1U2Z0_9PSED|nr:MULTISPECIES: bifunctional metallophosphatase/5'-nucleotidase [Pseudomonas]AZC16442.1 5'-nucleotidase [Pseudomonas sp. CMR5c]MQA52363.1 bifunctional metallophosphatase/5'-nucleotidase [Pseudomonas piscis]MQA57205.1 bifunctional metallophosphatase/5'-nucleotidase [Pseudomonas piscis]
MSRLRPVPLLLGALTLALATLAGCNSVSHEPQPVAVNIVAINDLHGNLQANPFSFKDPTAPGGVRKLQAGGIATLGGMLGQLRQEDPQLLFIGAGDLVGGSPPLSAMWADEPTLDALRQMGLKLSAIGNHELDQGKAEFLRQVNGGCQSPRPDKACQFRPDYAGSGFPYLAANLMDSDTGKPLLPAYRIEEVRGVKVAFVGAVLRDVAAMVSAKGMRGLQVADEADSINKLIPELKAQGANAIIAVVHQGGATPEPFDKPDCSQLGGDIIDVAKRLDPAVDVLVSAHSHQGYLCKVGSLLVTQGNSYGHLLTHLTLQVTPGQHRVTDIKAVNLLADPARYPQDPALARLQRDVEARSNEVLLSPVAAIGAPSITRRADGAGEMPLGDLIADAHLAAGQANGAKIAFMNTGGIRSDLALEPGQAKLNYGQLATLQPFNNALVAFDLTGRQLQQVLNQQWKGTDDANILQVSRGFSYRWDAKRPVGDRVVPGSLRLDGQPLRADARYRVVMNAFLGEGGDRFSLFKDGTQRSDLGISDLDAMLQYLKDMEHQGKPAGSATSAGRIQRSN